MVTIYTQPACAPCRAAEGALNRAGIEYEKLDITVDTAAAEDLKAAGYQQTPVFKFQGEYADMTGLRGIINKARS